MKSVVLSVNSKNSRKVTFTKYIPSEGEFNFHHEVGDVLLEAICRYQSRDLRENVSKREFKLYHYINSANNQVLKKLIADKSEAVSVPPLYLAFEHDDVSILLSCLMYTIKGCTSDEDHLKLMCYELYVSLDNWYNGLPVILDTGETTKSC